MLFASQLKINGDSLVGCSQMRLNTVTSGELQELTMESNKIQRQ